MEESRNTKCNSCSKDSNTQSKSATSTTNNNPTITKEKVSTETHSTEIKQEKN